MSKKMISMILALSMVLSMSAPVFANADTELLDENAVTENIETPVDNKEEEIEEKLNVSEAPPDKSENDEKKIENAGGIENQKDKDASYNIVPDTDIKIPDSTKNDILESFDRQQAMPFNAPMAYAIEPVIIAEGNAPYVFLYESGDLIFTDVKESDINKGNILAYASDVNTTEYSETTRPWYPYLKKVTTVTFKTEVTPTTLAYWFSKCESLSEIVGIENLKTENVTDTSYLFNQCYALTEIDLSHFNTSNVTNMAHMFDSMSHLKSIDVSSFDTSNVTNMEGMFRGLAEITELDISNFVTDRVKTYDYFMYGCSNITEVDVSTLSVKGFDSYNGNNGFSDTSGNGTKDMFTACLRLRSIKFGDDFAFRAGTGLPTQVSTYVPYTEGKWYNMTLSIETAQNGNNQNSSYNAQGLPLFQSTTMLAYVPVTITFNPDNGEDKIVVPKQIGDTIGELPKVPVKEGANFLRWGFKEVRPIDVVNDSITVKAIYDDDQEARAVLYTDNTLVFQRGPRVISSHGEIVDYFEGVEDEYSPDNRLYEKTYKYTKQGHRICSWSQKEYGYWGYNLEYVENFHILPKWAIYSSYILKEGEKEYCFEHHIERVEFIDKVFPKSTKHWFQRDYITGEPNSENTGHGSYDDSFVFIDYNDVNFNDIHNNLDMSHVKDSSFMFFTFANGTSEHNVDLREFPNYIFDSKNDISKWDLSSLEKSEYMFGAGLGYCYGYTGCLFDQSVEISNWKLPQLKIADSMFGIYNLNYFSYLVNTYPNVGCTFECKVDLTSWNCINIVSVSGMFGSRSGDYNENAGRCCTFKEKVNMKDWRTPKLKSAFTMFGVGVYTLGYGQTGSYFEKGIDFSGWDMPELSDTANMFSGCYIGSNLVANNLIFANVQRIDAMFNGMELNGNLEINNWTFSTIKEIRTMFSNATVNGTSTLSSWEFPELLKINAIFGVYSTGTFSSSDCYNLGHGARGCIFKGSCNLNGWNMPKLAEMNSLFGVYNTNSGLNGLKGAIFNASVDISNWYIPELKSETSTFGSYIYNSSYNIGCTFNDSVDISGWKMPKLETSMAMFGSCYAEIYGDSNNQGAAFNSLLSMNDWSLPSLKKCKSFFGAPNNGRNNIGSIFKESYSSNIFCANSNTENTDIMWAFSNVFNLCSVDISGLNGVTNGDKAFVGSRHLQEIRLGPGNPKTLFPTPNPAYIPDADGFWYDSLGTKYAPDAIPGNTAGVYYAISPRTVTFDPDNGDEVVSFKVPYMGTIDKSKINDPHKEGYVFTGWGTKDGALWNFNDPVTENMTLKAVYIAEVSYNAIQYSDGTIVFQQGDAEDASHGTVVQKVNNITTNVLTSSPWTVNPSAVTTVVFKDNLIPETTAYWFAGLTNLKTIENMQNLNKAETENEKAMLESYVLTNTTSMFNGCSSLTELDLSTMNMSKVDNMANMFNGCSSLNKVTFGPAFEFKGTNPYLPVNGDDGLWYTGEEYTEYTSANIPARTVGTYTTECPKYTVHFDTGEGAAIEDQIIKSHRTITKPSNPSATGYTFKHWALATDTAEAAFDWRTLVTSDMTLKAIYTPSTNIRYAVKAYTQNVNDDGYSEYMTVTTGLVGTAGEEVTYSIEAPTGMHLNTETSNTTDNIKGDGSLVLNFYFDRDLFTVTFDSKGGNEVDALENVKYGKAENLPVPTRAGYTFTGWVTPTGSPVASPLTVEKDYSLTATWSAQTTTKYVVETYLQNVACTDYVMNSQEYTGTTDANVIVNGATPYGFILNNDKSTMSGSVAGDGSLVLKLYFDRKGYSVVFDTAGGSDVGNLSDIPYETEKNIASPAKTGYTFAYWADENDVHYTFPMQILKDLQLTAVYTPNTNTAYKVITYLEDIDTDEYIKDSEVEKTGTTGADTTVTAAEIKGFTFNADNSSALTQTIEADGSTEFILKYDRNEYAVKIRVDNSVVSTQSIKFGGKVIEPEAPEAPEGYEFAGWVVDDIEYNFDIPVTGEITLDANFEACDGVAYTVKHIFAQLDGSDGEPVVETKYGVADTQITVLAKTQKGFIPDKDSQIITIAADGSTVVEFKYSRTKVIITVDNGVDEPTEVEVVFGDTMDEPTIPEKPGYTPVGWVDKDGNDVDFTQPIEDPTTIKPKYSTEASTFKVYHYLEKLEGGYADPIVEDYSGTTGATITIPAKKDLYGFTATKENEVLTVKGDGTSSVSFYYTRNEYTVEVEDADGNKTTQTVKYEGKATEPEVSKDGYTHVGWKDADRNTFTFDIPITKNLVLTPIFEANGDTPYAVEHYLQNLTQDGYDLADTENKTGATDSTATAMAKEYRGFTENVEYTNRVETGIITANGNLVLKLFYDRKMMKVTVKDENGASNVIEVPFGGTINKDDLGEPTKDGYAFDDWYVGDEKFDPDKPIEEDIELTPKFKNDNVKVTLELNGGKLDDGILPEVELKFGDTYETLPTPTKEGFVFEGWFDQDGNKINPEYTVSTKIDHTLYAKWKVEDSSDGNTGLITDKDDKPVPYAKVTVKQGNKIIRETVTDAYGYFSIKNIEDGYYNVVAEKNSIITTSLIQINKNTQDITKAKMNDGAIDSILNVKEGTKDVVVGNLDKLHENTESTQLFTPDDEAVVEAGGSVAFVMNVQAVTEEEIKENSSGLIVAAEEDNKTISRYLQMNISKTIKQATGESETVGLPDLGDHLLEIHIPLLPEQQGKTGYVVYRMHEGQVYEITETPNVNGAYIQIVGNDLVIFASKFSDYCLAYDKPKYTISIDPDNGTAPTTQEILEGKSLTKPADPAKSGYTFSKWVIKGTETEFDFTKPITENVEVIAVYTKNQSSGGSSGGGGGGGGGSHSKPKPKPEKTEDIKENETPKDSQHICPSLPYKDLDTSLWYHEATDWGISNKYFIGTGENIWSPNMTLTRAQAAVIVGRMMGHSDKETVDKTSYKDLTPTHWAASHIEYCTKNGYMIGYGGPLLGNFGPGDALTREQFALVLYRLYKTDDKAFHWDESQLDEAEKVSVWARDAMCWAVAKGIIKGDQYGDLMPQKAITRAEACMIVMRVSMDNK